MIKVRIHEDVLNDFAFKLWQIRRSQMSRPYKDSATQALISDYLRVCVGWGVPVSSVQEQQQALDVFNINYRMWVENKNRGNL